MYHEYTNPEISRLIKDEGNKYLQEYIDNITPNNVVKIDNDTIGVRMEDEGKIIKIDENKIAIVIADGHGSEEMMPGYYSGGYECADFAVNFAESKLKLLKRRSVHDIISNITKIMKSLFKMIQKKCLKYMLQGGIETKNENINGKNVCYTSKDNNLLWNEKDGFTSPIDGIYFEKINNIEIIKSMLDTIENQISLESFDHIVFGKAIEICKNINDVPFRIPVYCNYKNEKKSCLESGTTLTISLILKEMNDYYLFTSHVGDSNVVLYRKIDNYNFIKKKLTDDHSVNNKKEVERGKKYGMIPIKRHFASVKRQDVGLMPSRAIGHPYLSNFGIIEYPFISGEKLIKGDVVIFASDGLWDLHDESEKEIDDIIINSFDLNQNQICNILYMYYKNSMVKKDNITMCVLKMT